MKDNFSVQSNQYARFRPTYPDELFDYILRLTSRKDNLWDCATGNGQVAGKLAPYFKQVYATDISEAQIKEAVQLPNIQYSIQPAESTHFSDGLFDLVVVAQAIHWFNFEDFYKEVYRTLHRSGNLVVIGYQLLRISPDVDKAINRFQTDLVGKHWDEERKYIDEGYQTIPFPFKEINAPEFSMYLQWTFEHLIGYLDTWSAVKHFEKQNGYNPVERMKGEFKEAWGNEEYRRVEFPIMLRIGTVE